MALGGQILGGPNFLGHRDDCSTPIFCYCKRIKRLSRRLTRTNSFKSIPHSRAPYGRGCVQTRCKNTQLKNISFKYISFKLCTKPQQQLHITQNEFESKQKSLGFKRLLVTKIGKIAFYFMLLF